MVLGTICHPCSGLHTGGVWRARKDETGNRYVIGAALEMKDRRNKLKPFSFHDAGGD
jgi:hypothetical protein